MTPEEHSLLERTYKISEENNSILRGMRRAGRISLIFRIVYWGIIIGLSVGAYYFVQPYVNTMLDLLGGTGSANPVDNLKNILKTPR